MFTLQSDRLKVTIAEPNKECRTSRFDRAGFITGVTLDGQYAFLGQEDMLDGSPSSGGMGLCSEIQFDPLSEEVPVGEKFVKIGVGNLVKNEEAPYYFMNAYVGEDFEITTEQADDAHIRFVTAPAPLCGYAVKQVKEVSVSGNELVVGYTLTNEGDKEITFDEYCHNFMTLNRKKVNSDYYLTIPCLDIPAGEIRTLDICTCFHSDGKGLSKTEESMVFALYAFEKEQMHPVDVYDWQLVDKKSGLCVSETDDFAVDKITVWSVGDVISPEMFFHACLLPGQSVSWSRKYVFSKKAE